jgi:hypothetical protein
MIDDELRGPEDMPRRRHRKPGGPSTRDWELDRFTPTKGASPPCGSPFACGKKRCGLGRCQANRRVSPTEMVAVRVGYEGCSHGARRIEVQIQCRYIKPCVIELHSELAHERKVLLRGLEVKNVSLFL